MEQFLDGLGVHLGEARISTLAFFLVLILLLLGLIQYLITGPKGTTILLLGPMGAGKTTIYLQLRDGTKHNGTVTSMQVTSESCQLASEKGGRKIRPVTLVDIPGHPRMRHRFEAHTPATRGIIFVIDSAEFLSQKTDIAEQLYEVITNLAAARRKPPILLACNKSDLGAKAHTSDFIRKRIEKEVEQLRTTRRSLGEGQQGVIGIEGEVFSMAALEKAQGIKVTAESVSALDADLDDVTGFIRRCVPRR
ncbi:hypothetical protein WJX73_000210 [Symbiochloris irregularis]|uniref:Signal recognition particle receptor subunit beta n=1 Tax=Symbiochloris irregularis TaxID=706552 RepID=A0AAW1PXX2_9CHLO